MKGEPKDKNEFKKIKVAIGSILLIIGYKHSKLLFKALKQKAKVLKSIDPYLTTSELYKKALVSIWKKLKRIVSIYKARIKGKVKQLKPIKVMRDEKLNIIKKKRFENIVARKMKNHPLGLDAQIKRTKSYIVNDNKRIASLKKTLENVSEKEKESIINKIKKIEHIRSTHREDLKKLKKLINLFEKDIREELMKIIKP